MKAGHTFLKSTLTCATLLLAAQQLLPAGSSAEPLYVGALEYIHRPNRRCGEPPKTAPLYAQVRFAFRKDADGWHAISEGVTNRQPALPSRIRWYVAGGADPLGVVETAEGPCPNHMSGAQLYAQDVTTAEQDIPRPLRNSTQLTLMSGEHDEAMPLLAASKPNIQDPENWAPQSRFNNLSAAQQKIAIREFRKLVPTREQCEEPEGRRLGKVNYPDSEILVSESIMPLNGEIIVVRQQLAATRWDCGGFDADEDRNYWFSLYPDGSVRMLGSNMTFIHAADVDGDGKSELLFYKRPSPYPSDGYVLFYDRLARSVEVGWGYN